MKPKLLIVELWGMGDLVIATPFLRQACEQYEVTLLAKPYAREMQERLWPHLNVIAFTAPWTAFAFGQKYWFPTWPWREMLAIRRKLALLKFDAAATARWDPRDHFLLWLSGAKQRIGFPRMGSQRFLTRPLNPPPATSHRYEYWRTIGAALDFKLPERAQLPQPVRPADGAILVHTGAAQPLRVWPLERYRLLVARLRAQGRAVTVACNPEQERWWRRNGESGVVAPKTVARLLELLDQAAVFVGNDSGPGHLAASQGLPTFTLFGPQVPEWFVPLHTGAEFVAGKACPFKPCSDYCRFAEPHCIRNITEEEVWMRLQAFLGRRLQSPNLIRNPEANAI